MVPLAFNINNGNKRIVGAVGITPEGRDHLFCTPSPVHRRAVKGARLLSCTMRYSLAIAMGASLLCTACEGLAIKATAAALLAEYSQRERLALYVTMDHRSEATRTSFVRLLSSSGHLARDYMAMDLASDEQGGNFGARLVSAYFHIEPSVHPVIFPTALVDGNAGLFRILERCRGAHRPEHVTLHRNTPRRYSWRDLGMIHLFSTEASSSDFSAISRIPFPQVAEHFLSFVEGSYYLLESPSRSNIVYVAHFSKKDRSLFLYVLIQLAYLRASPLLTDENRSFLDITMHEKCASLNARLRMAFMALCEEVHTNNAAYMTVRCALQEIVQESQPSLPAGQAALWEAKLLIAYVQRDFLNESHPEHASERSLLAGGLGDLLRDHAVSAVPIYLLRRIMELFIEHRITIGPDVGISAETVREIDGALSYSGRVYLVFAVGNSESLQATGGVWTTLPTAGRLVPPTFAMGITEALEWLGNSEACEGADNLVRVSPTLARPAILVTSEARRGGLDGSPIVCRDLETLIGAILDELVADDRVFTQMPNGSYRFGALEPSHHGTSYGLQQESTLAAALARLIVTYTFLTDGRLPAHFGLSFYRRLVPHGGLHGTDDSCHASSVLSRLSRCEAFVSHLKNNILHREPREAIGGARRGSCMDAIVERARQLPRAALNVWREDRVKVFLAVFVIVCFSMKK